MKKAYVSWMGANVVVFATKRGKPKSSDDRVIKVFKAGSRNMPENMAKWAAINGYDITNLRRDKKTGALKVWL